MKKLRFVETIVSNIDSYDFPTGLTLSTQNAGDTIRQIASNLSGKDLSKYSEISMEIDTEFAQQRQVTFSFYGVREESDEEFGNRRDKELEQLKELISRHPEAARSML